jgi:uncharacterized protein (TIGR02246 family)
MMDSKETEGVQKLAQDFFAAWNKNDVAALTGFWTDDATLINPSGRMAHGKTEIQQLFTEEQTTIFKGSVANVTDVKTRHLGNNMAFFDESLTIDNAHGPDGSALPQMNFHISGIAQMKGGKWQLVEARPYAFLMPMPAPAKSE